MSQKIVNQKCIYFQISHYEKVDFWKIFAPAAPIGTAGEYFRSNSSKSRQKISQNVYLFRQNNKIFARAFGAGKLVKDYLI